MDVLILTDPVVLIVAILAAARLTRLITTDTFGEPVRLAVSRSDFGRELIHCPWCIGFWISLAVALVTMASWPHPVTVVVLIAFAISEAVGLIAVNDGG